MTYHPLFIIANSRKLNGRCVAGIDLLNQNFPIIRPVSCSDSGSLTLDQIAPVNETELRVFTTVNVPLTDPAPDRYQTENWTVDQYAPWQQAGNPKSIQLILDKTTSTCPNLWTQATPDGDVGTDYNSWRGQRDRLPEIEANKLTSSLALIKLHTMRIDKWLNQESGEIESYRGNFKYQDRYFNMKITDPEIADFWESLPRAKSRRPHENRPYVHPKHTGEVFLTVSLGLPFEGFVYKLIANIHPASSV